MTTAKRAVNEGTKAVAVGSRLDRPVGRPRPKREGLSMIERETLTKAALAAGLALPEPHPKYTQADPIGRQYTPALGLWVCWKWGWGWFNPVHDGAHAMWLVVELGLQVVAYPMYDELKHSVIVRKPVWDHDKQEGDGVEVLENYGRDPHAATRAAITRAAAEWAGHKTPNVEAKAPTEGRRPVGGRP